MKISIREIVDSHDLVSSPNTYNQIRFIMNEDEYIGALEGNTIICKDFHPKAVGQWEIRYNRRRKQ